MLDYIELQNVGESSQETQSRLNTSTVTISLRAAIISVLTLAVIFVTLILTSIYFLQNDKLYKTDLRPFEGHLSTPHLTQLVNNLQQEYVEVMNQNISQSLFLDTNALIELHDSTRHHILQIYDDTEEPFIEVDANTVSSYRNKLSDKIDKSFVTISHEQTFRRIASEDWNLANETKEHIKKLYDEEFQAAVTKYEGRDPPEVSPEFHQHVSELTLSKGVARKVVPPSPKVFSELRKILNAKYNKTLQDHVVIGIDFGERYVRSYDNVNGHLRYSARFNSYVGLEDFDTHHELVLKANFKFSHSNYAVPIFYDLKEIIRDWNSLNTSSDKLFWTFEVQEGNHGGPLVSSSKTGIEYPVELVLAKLLQRVRKANNNATRCVITVPYDFKENQRNLILYAGNTAGFEGITLFDEDIAAAFTLQYVNGPWSVSKNIMFLEFDQLSWKIYVLEGHQSKFKRIVSAAYNETQDVVNYCIKEYCQHVECDNVTFKYDGSIEARIRWRHLYEKCEDVIFSFSSNSFMYHHIIASSTSPTLVDIYRNKTDEAIQKQVVHFTHFIDSILRQKQVKLPKARIDEVIMGGKYGNLRAIKEIISGYFNGRNLTINGVSPDNTVAYGAAVKGLELAAEAIKQSRLNGTVV